jgi:hypothetical protein
MAALWIYSRVKLVRNVWVNIFPEPSIRQLLMWPSLQLKKYEETVNKKIHLLMLDRLQKLGLLLLNALSRGFGQLLGHRLGLSLPASNDVIWFEKSVPVLLTMHGSNNYSCPENETADAQKRKQFFPICLLEMINFLSPWHLGTVQIRIRTTDLRFRILLFCQWLTRCQLEICFFFKFYFFSRFWACWWKNPNPDRDPKPHKIMTDPDPGGPKNIDPQQWADWILFLRRNLQKFICLLCLSGTSRWIK